MTRDTKKQRYKNEIRSELLRMTCVVYFSFLDLMVGYFDLSMCCSVPRLWVYSEEAVPLFGPPLPCPAVFTDHREFRDFLLVKRTFHTFYMVYEMKGRLLYEWKHYKFKQYT